MFRRVPLELEVGGLNEVKQPCGLAVTRFWTLESLQRQFHAFTERVYRVDKSPF